MAPFQEISCARTVDRWPCSSPRRHAPGPVVRPTTDAAAVDSTAHLAHAAYTTAINSNNLDSIMGMMTEDVVFLTAHAPPMVGKAAVRPWVDGYLQAFTTQWDKEALDFEVAGAWAFERYS